MEQNYLPLFRKYRPQSFKDIVGQESLVKALSNAIELNRIANAYLFCGPRGTGKTSTARILAKSLNCEHGPTLEPCQKCASCVDITNTSGLDVIEIDAASNRGIQDAKDLISQVQYAPINGKYKIFIIDEVHMLTTEAFNALLKTFEEPPKNVIFILATTEPHKVLETIVSRCQRFDLRRITVDDIVKRLREISDLENIKITQEALYTIAKNVSGGLRDSLALLDQVSILGIKEEIDKDLIEELLGKINFDTLLNLLQKINSKNVEETISCINNIYAKGNEPRNLAENFIEFLRNVILVLESKNDETITGFTNLIKDDIEKIKSNNFEKDNIFKILNIFIEYYKEIKISTNPYLWVELAGLNACKGEVKSATIQKQPLAQKEIKPIPPVVEIKKEEIKPAVENVKPAVENIKSVAQEIKPSYEEIKPVVEEVKPAQEEEQQTETTALESQQAFDPSSLWANIVNSITSVPANALYSAHAKLVGIKDSKITLGFINENLIQMAKADSKLSHLKSAIDKVAKGYSVEFIKINSDTKTIETKSKTEQPKINQNASYQTQPINNVSPVVPVKNDEKEETNEEMEREKKQYSPKVQEMIEQYNGRIIE